MSTHWASVTLSSGLYSLLYAPSCWYLFPGKTYSPTFHHQALIPTVIAFLLYDNRMIGLDTLCTYSYILAQCNTVQALLSVRV